MPSCIMNNVGTVSVSGVVLVKAGKRSITGISDSMSGVQFVMLYLLTVYMHGF